MANRNQPSTLDGRDLTALAAAAELPAPLFRDAELAEVLERLAAGRCVLLCGPEGVGKSAVVHAVAHALNRGSPLPARRRLIEAAAADVMVGTRYLGEWETKASALLDGIRRRKAVLYYSDVWRLPVTGVSSNSPSSLLDLLRPRVVSGELLLLGEVTPETLLAMGGTRGFVELFDVVTVAPLAEARLQDVVVERARALALEVPPEGVERICGLCEQFLSGGARPGPVLRLLERVHGYAREKRGSGEPEVIGAAFVEKVFSIYSGLPREVVDTAGLLRAANLREWFGERIMGQAEAIEAVVESIVLFKAAVNDPGKPLGSFLFVGPTGVGKTELAKALALYLFGSERRLLRFDLSEFGAYDSFKQLVGDPDAPAAPARLTDPLGQQPFQVVLFDELEKGHVNVRDLLLQILDEARLTDARGRTVSLRNAFVIVTSNVGAGEADRRAIGFGGGGEAGEPGYAGRLREGLESFFRLEFLNRFQYIVPFHPLRPEHVERIVRKEIGQVLQRRGIGARALTLEVTDALITRIAERGYDRRYGARALKREIQQRLVVPVATVLAERRIEPGSLLKVDVASSREGGEGSSSVRVIDTVDSRERARESAPVRDPDGRPRTRAELLAAAAALPGAIAALRAGLDGIGGAREAGGHARRIAALESRSARANLWADTAVAGEVLTELDRLRTAGARVERLGVRAEALRERLASAGSRERLARAAGELHDLQRAADIARLELLRIGPDGEHDVLVELVPIGAAREGRDRLHALYADWARWRGHEVHLLREPLDDEEPVLMLIEGAYVHGYLHQEAGVHRFRHERRAAGTVRVRLAADTGERCTPALESRTALKKVGQLGGRVRSRTVVTEPARLVLQNGATLERNREAATRHAVSWRRRPPDTDATVRRYDREPFLIKDHLSGQRFDRGDALRPEAFHELLSRRLMLSAEASGEEGAAAP